MKKNVYAILLLLVCSGAYAQMDVDRSINLTGTSPNAKISGIKDVNAAQDAVSVEVLQRGSLIYAASAGTSSAYTLTLPVSPGAYTTGMEIRFRAHTANAAGVVTINVNGMGLKDIKKDVSANLAAGDIQINQLVTLAYDGTNFQLISRTTDANSGGTITGSGTLNNVAKFTPSGTSLGNSLISDDGSNVSVAGTGAVKMPVGTTAQRPGSPTAGMMRFNTTYNKLEYYNGSSWKILSQRYLVASGGNSVYDVSGYRIHMFTSSGTFTVDGSGTVEVLVVAGGGGGTASPWGGGGGGGGGVIYHATYPVSTGNIAVTVGNGGAPDNNGGDSYFGPMQAMGGGRACSNCGAGGSGGGTSHSNPGGGNNPSTQTSNNGGTGYGWYGGNAIYTPPYWMGSGGGAGGPGCYGCNGGSGITFSISGSSVTYAGGGGQCNNNGNATAGGAGGGGTGANGNAGWGTANTGGGGGGSRAGAAGGGGSGIVIVRYPIYE